MHDGGGKVFINPVGIFQVGEKDGAFRQSEGKYSSLFDFQKAERVTVARLKERLQVEVKPAFFFFSCHFQYYQPQKEVISFSSLMKAVILAMGYHQDGLL